MTVIDKNVLHVNERRDKRKRNDFLLKTRVSDSECKFRMKTVSVDQKESTDEKKSADEKQSEMTLLAVGMTLLHSFSRVHE